MGKTTLALELAREYQRLGYKVGVYTVPATLDTPPRADPRWSFVNFLTMDRAVFLQKFRSSWKVMWFVDECNRTVGWHDKEMEAVATSGSLNGATVHFIAQRPATFNRTVREQCTSVYMFRLGGKDCQEIYEQWDHEEILEARKFRKGQALFFNSEVGSVKRIDLKLA